jgi:hypothetical protein
MTSKETAAEQILAKHLGWDTFSGGSVMCNTSEILAAMKEYGASLQPKEADVEKLFADEALSYSLRMKKLNGGSSTDYYVHYMNGIIVGYKAATTKLNK